MSVINSLKKVETEQNNCQTQERNFFSFPNLMDNNLFIFN
jgi:hypothetical protein